VPEVRWRPGPCFYHPLPSRPLSRGGAKQPSRHCSFKLPLHFQVDTAPTPSKTNDTHPIPANTPSLLCTIVATIAIALQTFTLCPLPSTSVSSACDPSDLICLQLSSIPVQNYFETRKYPLEERGGSL
jgi:hypothetical protein